MFTAHDIAGYMGKEVEVWVKLSNSTAPNQSESALGMTAKKIRGAQSFNPTEEKAESRVSELGFEATKVIYGTSTFSISTSLLIRDLVQIARLSGLNPDNSNRIVVSEFQRINALNWITNPDDKSEVYATVYVSGFKPRTASKALAVEANATITLDGSADLVATFDGKATVREHTADGSCDLFAIAAGLGWSDVYMVENPSGTAMPFEDGYSFWASGVGGVPSIKFTTAPDNGTKVKVIYKTTGLTP